SRAGVRAARVAAPGNLHKPSRNPASRRTRSSLRLVHANSVGDNTPFAARQRRIRGESLVEKILVGLKRVVDFNVRVRVKSDGTGVETDGVKMSINPFDEIALEEALRMRERGEASEIIAVSIGSSEAQQQLRTGLAMGA